jgi:spermidine synthase
MIPWQRLESAPLPPAPSSRGVAPAAAELTLWRRGDELSIRIGGNELMNSRQHHSEDELGRLACAHLTRGHVARVLIGGLGMGFTLRAVLDATGPRAAVEVAELLPAVVEWNRGVLGGLAGHPLNDPRVRVFEGDVGARINHAAGHAAGQAAARYDAILLDVDNGPAALSAAGNSRLYDRGGLEAVRAALRPGGVLAVWSATDDPRFSRRLRTAGFDVLRHHVRARPEAGAIHVLSIATLLAPERGARPEAALPSRGSHAEARSRGPGRGPDRAPSRGPDRAPGRAPDRAPGRAPDRGRRR